MDYSENRKRFVGWIRSCLVGPNPQTENLIRFRPIDRYHVGVLFPVVKGVEGVDPITEDADEDTQESLQAEDVKIISTAESGPQKRRYIPPSSVGFSFFIKGKRIEVEIECSAVKYNRVKEREKGQFTKEEWERIELPPPGVKRVRSNKVRKIYSERIRVFEHDAEIYCLWRPYEDGWITTISLANTKEMLPDSRDWNLERSIKCLFETNLKCKIVDGSVGSYPKIDKSLLTDEEQEIELQYKHRHIYAIGHGAAVDWKIDNNGRVTEIQTEFLPVIEVPQVTVDAKGNDNEALKLAFLEKCGKRVGQVCEQLDLFVASYENWVNKQQNQIHEIAQDDYERGAGNRILKRMRNVVLRMRRGVALFRSNPLITRAFGMANAAMLSQMAQYDRSKGHRKPLDHYRWRPFQLAFLLTVLESTINEDSDCRDTVDLIWFPTGGGKTEAYLGLVAIQIIWRRLTNPSTGGGTTILMRYTLRLLTTQQYLRAARLICALELIRRETPELGKEPITIGLWVGEATSPNSFESAQKIVNQAAQGNGAPPLKLVLSYCPWCGQPFKAPNNYKATPVQFNFRCLNDQCEFADNGILPCNVVDEALYDSPATLIIATIDKFARLAWDERTAAFFGRDGNRPPELIIQDELHLIAGPLGSVAGLYEAALDTVITQRGVHPKYIASTATIRFADQQVRTLYGREVAIFPPPGLSFEDSFFARTVPTDVRPGRLYIGYLSPMLGREKCLAPLSAALLVAPEAVFRDGHADLEVWLDAWWTQVVYHGSLKGVGISHNAFSTDVREYCQQYMQELQVLHLKGEPESGEGVVTRTSARIAQLTSLSNAEDNVLTFSRLEKCRNDTGYLDAVLATNMISVGLDVARLALMVINGQPLTTAEYIQASSRVGRSDVPGVVFVNYYRDQARSLSHYESFRPYHESFYRFVEPTSITPYTYQARKRALHAALVIAMRYGCAFMLSNRAAANFDAQNPCIQKVLEALKTRCGRGDPERMCDTADHIDRLSREWELDIARCRNSRVQLNYHASDKDKATDRLLYNHDDKIKGLWPTLQSMRNVEETALLKQL